VRNDAASLAGFDGVVALNEPQERRGGGGFVEGVNRATGWPLSRQAVFPAGEDAVYYGTKLRGASNQKAKRTFGFEPRRPIGSR